MMKKAAESSLFHCIHAADSYEQRERLSRREDRQTKLIHRVDAPIHPQIAHDSQNQEKIHSGVEAPVREEGQATPAGGSQSTSRQQHQSPVMFRLLSPCDRQRKATSQEPAQGQTSQER
jgi:hypothetical protein